MRGQAGQAEGAMGVVADEGQGAPHPWIEAAIAFGSRVGKVSHEERSLQGVQRQLLTGGKGAHGIVVHGVQRTEDGIQQILVIDVQVEEARMRFWPAQPLRPGGAWIEVGPQEIPGFVVGVGAVVLRRIGFETGQVATGKGDAIGAGGSETTPINSGQKQPVIGAVTPFIAISLVAGEVASEDPGASAGNEAWVNHDNKLKVFGDFCNGEPRPGLAY